MKDRANRPLVVFGAHRFAELVRCRAEETGFHVSAFSVDREYCRSDELGGLPVIAFDELPKRFPPSEFDLLVAVGYRSMRARRAVTLRAREFGYRLARVISPGACVGPNVILGDNTMVFPGVVLEPNVIIGADNVFWPGTIICHDTVVGSHNFFAPGVVVCGNCTIGDLCFFGARATILDGVSVGSECQVLPCAALWSDSAPFGRYGGVPGNRVGEVDREKGVRLQR